MKRDTFVTNHLQENMANKNTPQDSPEKAIRERARNLPFGKIYVNQDWEDARQAQVIVTREHVNGNVTAGFYLVDLLCLGVKDSFFYFNIPVSELEEQLETFRQEIEIVEIDYITAHNIIYAGLEFATELGFKPGKLFEISKFILEDDNDSVELMEIECGEDGVPVVLTSEDNPQTDIIRQLDAKLGEGNYVVYDIDDLEDEEDEDEDDNDTEEEYELTDEDVARIRDILSNDNPSEEDLDFLADAISPVLFTSDALDDCAPVVEIDNLKFVDSDGDVEEGDLELYKTTAEEIENADLASKIAILKAKYDKEANKVYATLLAKYYTENAQIEDAAALLKNSVELYPTNLTVWSTYLSYLLFHDKNDEVTEILAERFLLEELFPAREEFEDYSVLRFYSVLAMYFANIGDTDRAIDYLYAIDGIRQEFSPMPEWFTAIMKVMSDKLK